MIITGTVQVIANKAIAINPEYAQAYCNLGAAYGSKNMLDEAIAAYMKAIDINPHYVEAHYNLAVAYYKKGNYKLAIVHCDKVVELEGSVDPELGELLRAYR